MVLGRAEGSRQEGSCPLGLCVWLQDGTTPRALHFSATIFFSGLKLRAPQVYPPDPRGWLSIWCKRSEQTVREKAESLGRKPCKWGREDCFVSKKKDREGKRGGPEGTKGSHRVLSEETTGQGTGCQKPSPARAGTSVVKEAPSAAKRNSLTQKSRGQLWKRTRGLTRAQTACVFATLTQCPHSQADHPKYTRKKVIIWPLA